MQIHEPIEPFTFLWWKGLLSCLILISLIFIFFTKKKKYKNAIVKNTCNEIDETWLHAYKYNGKKENTNEL